MAIEWSADIELGVARIDNQHKELIGLINQVLEACNQGKGKEAVGQALNFVMSYTLTHFSSEEELMQQKNYPDFPRHKRLHEGFIADVTLLKKDFEKVGPTIAVVIALNRLLVDWLIKHIRNEDKAIAAFLKRVK